MYDHDVCNPLTYYTDITHFYKMYKHFLKIVAETKIRTEINEINIFPNRMQY